MQHDFEYIECLHTIVSEKGTHPSEQWKVVKRMKWICKNCKKEKNSWNVQDICNEVK